MNVSITEKETQKLIKSAMAAELKSCIKDKLSTAVEDSVDEWMVEHRGIVKSMIGDRMRALMPTLIDKYVKNIEKDGYLNLEW